MKNTHSLLYLSVIFIFFGIVSSSLFSDGMFMDGLLYSAISNNMANGLGSFWKPYLSESVFPEFYEHPPLALGLQSVWFRLFGDSIQVERFYSLFTFLLSSIGLIACWKQLGQSLKTGWLPLFFWLMVSNVLWSCSNNMLENTMTVFVVFSAWACLKGFNTEKLSYFMLAGMFLSLAMLSKGFVCLYLWALPISFFFFHRSLSFFKAISYTIILIAFTLLPLLLLYFLSEDAAFNMTSYFNKQVVGSIQNATTVNSRFAIFGEFIQHTLFPLIVGVIIILSSLKSKGIKAKLKENKSIVAVFTFILFCGIAPIMISLKQRGFYILTIYPFFGLVLGLIISPLLKDKLSKIENNARFNSSIKVVTLCLIAVALCLSIINFNTIGRDHEEVRDAKKVIAIIGEGTSLNICPSQFGNWSKHGYYSRYGNITLIRNESNECDYFLMNKGQCGLNLDDYELVNTELEIHNLYRRK